MKRHFKIFTLGICSLLCVAMVGCGQTERRTVYELPYYDGSAYEDGAEKAITNCGVETIRIGADRIRLFWTTRQETESIIAIRVSERKARRIFRIGMIAEW